MSAPPIPTLAAVALPLGGSPLAGLPPAVLAQAVGLTLLATASAAAAVALWVGQRGRREVLARLTRHQGARALRALAGDAAANPFALDEVRGWRGEVLTTLARYTPAGLRGPAAAEALARAGYFEPTALLYYGAVRVLAPLLMPVAVVALTGGAAPLALALGLLVGVVGPNAVLDRMAGTRRTALVLAIPDALDLLIVCLEAGVGADAALVRVAREVSPTHPVLGAELDNVTRRISAGLPREEALRALVTRTGVDDLRAIVTTMIQAEKLGTSLARVLRIHGEALRNRRKQKAEKKAAEASVKMILPLVLFLLPAFFAVVLGPAILSLAKGVGGP